MTQYLYRNTGKKREKKRKRAVFYGQRTGELFRGGGYDIEPSPGVAAVVLFLFLTPT
jgi:hypothetical protein